MLPPLQERPQRVVEIDRLKGLAMLGVICIHAKLGDGTELYEQLINRAVPVFVVLFGATSELWWSAQSARVALGGEARGALHAWYRTRGLRLLVPAWSAVTLWWLMAYALGATTPRHLSWLQLGVSYLGYAPWIGISWFVTLVLQLVLVFPALRWVQLRLGDLATLLVAFGLSSLCTWELWQIVDFGYRHLGSGVPKPGWYYFWIFSPRFFWQVAAGSCIARFWHARPSARVTVVAAGVFVVSVVLSHVARGAQDDVFAGPLREQIVMRFGDVPLALALLGVAGWLCAQGRAARFLVWLGLASWGVYLGHMLVHELFHLTHHAPETGPTARRVLYALTLLGGGCALARLGDRLRSLLAAWLTRGKPGVPGS
ncbi:MAG TPA: acyltransferase family protein [Polyangiales bacterium]